MVSRLDRLSVNAGLRGENPCLTGFELVKWGVSGLGQHQAPHRVDSFICASSVLTSAPGFGVFDTNDYLSLEVSFPIVAERFSDLAQGVTSVDHRFYFAGFN